MRTWVAFNMVHRETILFSQENHFLIDLSFEYRQFAFVAGIMYFYASKAAPMLSERQLLCWEPTKKCYKNCMKNVHYITVSVWPWSSWTMEIYATPRLSQRTCRLVEVKTGGCPPLHSSLVTSRTLALNLDSKEYGGCSPSGFLERISFRCSMVQMYPTLFKSYMSRFQTSI